jgi:hypothetical protein
MRQDDLEMAQAVDDFRVFKTFDIDYLCDARAVVTIQKDGEL